MEQEWIESAEGIRIMQKRTSLSAKKRLGSKMEFLSFVFVCGAETPLWGGTCIKTRRATGHRHPAEILGFSETEF